MAQQAKKKKVFTKPGIDSIKEALGLLPKSKNDLSLTVADKKMEWIVMPEAFQKALKLPGIPMGYFTIVSGWSNTGKSTLKHCLIAACQEQGVLPVIFETENNFDWRYAIDCGVQATPVIGDVPVEDVDEETGEVTVHYEKGIVNYTGPFLYYDTSILAEKYGEMNYTLGKKTPNKKRDVAVLEDITYAMNEILDYQNSGQIQQPICFIWDSVGSIISQRELDSKVNNNMFNAGAISVAFNTLLNDRIPSSRKANRPYSNTFFAVNKIWNDSMNSTGGAASIELKGGKSFKFQARLQIHVGGVAKAGTKKLTAVSKGETYNYDILTKIKVEKNHLPAPFNITYEGTMACVGHGIISESELDEYKKTHAKEFLTELEALLKDKGKTPSGGELSFEESEESDD